MTGLFALPALLMGVTTASGVMRSFVSPVMLTLCAAASLTCVFFVVNGGIAYMTSAGKPEQLENAKKILRNALVGLVIVFAAGALTQILMHAYPSTSAATHSAVPKLTAINPAPPSNGLVAVIIKAITGVLNDIVQFLTSSFLKSLAFFTKATPLMADNQTVFNMWLGVVGMSDVLFVLVIALLGFHVMSATSFGLDEIEIKHMMPRLALIFLALNTSIFAIDGVIELSNAMIHAVTLANGTNSLWAALTDVVKQSASMSMPALLIMLLFTVFSVVLVIYYVIRLITLYLGAILSPLVLLLWLIPGFRDFAMTAARTYLMTIFVLFVQVVVLVVAGSLIAGVVVGSPTQVSGELMPLVTGVGAMYAVLKVPSTMEKLSFASMGQQSVRQLGGQFIYGMRLMNQNRKTTAKVVKTARTMASRSGNEKKNTSSGGSSNSGSTYKQPKPDTAGVNTPQGGTTVVQVSKQDPKPKESKGGKKS